MKITDTRDQTVIEGELVATLPAHQVVGQHDMQLFFRTVPGCKNYGLLSAAQPIDRVVLSRGDPEDRHYYIVPKYPFYKVEP